MLPVREDNPDALGTVYRAPTSHDDDAVTAGRFENLRTLHYLVVAGVGTDVGKNRIPDTFLIKASRNILYPAGTDEIGTGDDKCVTGTKVSGISPGKQPGICPDNKFRSNKFPQFEHGIFHPVYNS